MLGIVMGVAAVITTVALGNGAADVMDRFVAGVGVNMLLVFPGRAGQGQRSASLTLADAEALRHGVFISKVVPETYGGARLVCRARSWSTNVQGTTPDTLDVREWRIAEGRMFTPAEMTSAVCVLGATVARNLGLSAHGAVGTMVRVKNTPFRVIGVMRPKGPTPWGYDQDDIVLVPLVTAQRRLFRSGNALSRITLKAAGREYLAEATAEARAVLRQRHRLTKGDDFVMYDMTAALENAARSTHIMRLLLGATAFVSLLVGGIGIMNIMLVSVSERTREIGIRMAVGARPWDVRRQFLTEAAVLSGVGGGLGVICGAALSRALTGLFGWPTIVSAGAALAAAGGAALVGVAFGFWPAWKASALNPIDALRSE
jgi:putative ABC transport system permease protein